MNIVLEETFRQSNIPSPGKFDPARFSQQLWNCLSFLDWVSNEVELPRGAILFQNTYYMWHNICTSKLWNQEFYNDHEVSMIQLSNSIHWLSLYLLSITYIYQNLSKLNSPYNVRLCETGLYFRKCYLQTKKCFWYWLLSSEGPLPWKGQGKDEQNRIPGDMDLTHFAKFSIHWTDGWPYLNSSRRDGLETSWCSQWKFFHPSLLTVVSSCLLALFLSPLFFKLLSPSTY